MYVRSVLTYAGSAWGPTLSKSNWAKVEVVQNIRLRTTFAAPYYVSISTIQNTAGQPTIRDYILRNAKILFYKYIFSKYPHIHDLGRSTQHFRNEIKNRPFSWTNYFTILFAIKLSNTFSHTL